MEIPEYLISQIFEKKVVLILGAGASLVATDSNGNSPPTGRELGFKLADKFLGGKYKDCPLSQISELAISESSLFKVQEYIKDIFEPFQPSVAHKNITTIPWCGLATTNYDLVVETAYEQNKRRRCQIVKPLIENGDNVEDNLQDPDAVLYLKLHGCIRRISNPDCPLILATDQYIDYLKGRERIFDHLINWGFNNILVFIGHSLQDHDLRAIISKLTSLCKHRLRYYIVTPDSDDIQKRFWETKKITTLKGTFFDFVDTIIKKNPSPFRALVKTNDVSLPIYNHFREGYKSLTKSAINFIENDVEFVKTAKSRVIEARDFYRGYNAEWAPIEQDLDIRRTVTDDILIDHFLSNESTNRHLEFVLIKGHAGSGKSVLLRRLAWEASHEYNCLCIYLKKFGKISTSAIEEIASLSKDRVYIFIDNISEKVVEINRFIDKIGFEAKNITIVGAVRVNEWNVSCTDIQDVVTSEYKLKYLSESEIIQLLDKLEKHRALGVLENKNFDERKAAFEVTYKRQLLVALHEATLGKPFEEIIEDEYNNIVPLSAQEIYMNICTLNRFDVPVRAGIISRLHNIPMSEFRKKFFKPLERIVYTKKSDEIRDYVYVARHPCVAEIVFDRILKSPDEKYNKYIDCLNALNIDYKSDRQVFRKLIHGKTLLRNFPNREHVDNIYKLSLKIDEKDSYLLQQIAIFEMNRTDGDYEKCIELLNEASNIDPLNDSIKHSISELYLKRSESAKTVLDKERLLSESEKRAKYLIKKGKWKSYAYHTLIKIYLAKINMYIGKEFFDEKVLNKLLSEAEIYLSDGMRECPDNSFILDADAKLAIYLSDSNRALNSLKKAFESNQRNTFIALRLAKYFKTKKLYNEAKEILEKALDANQTEKRLHFLYATLLIEMNSSEGEAIAYHLKKSFNEGDTNYIAQVLYGRQLFLNNKYEECNDFFRKQRERRYPGDFLFDLKYKIENAEYQGEIVKKENLYGFIFRDGTRDQIFMHKYNTKGDIWDKLEQGKRVQFKVAFNLKGPYACDIIEID